MKEDRVYLPLLPELIDRLSVVELKSLKLGCNDKEKKEVYEKEANLIRHDINLIMQEKKDEIKDWGKFITGVHYGHLANEVIWQNESFVRMGGSMSPDNVAKHLQFTHAVNAVRMHGGNMIANQFGTQKDLNSDRLNNEICIQMGYNFSGCFS